MLEADAVDRIVQLDVDAEVVAVELELVAGAQAGVLIDVYRQRGNGAVEGQLEVLVLGWVSLVFDAGGGSHGGVSSAMQHDSAWFGC
ncbi:hypothetical protein OR16_38072 [Cupriavidus basilensis OR16]|uniref:Uncharacterized protein n=1 Tax=Cupriavidus basilensis OR16 TaxID=1127483 RepID=H1SGS7_9BURK|nr:hypothetical protein OR16_38072 [Cupriavidus basilensis OR16]